MVWSGMPLMLDGGLTFVRLVWPNSTARDDSIAVRSAEPSPGRMHVYVAE
jgi:hypothetical protein